MSKASLMYNSYTKLDENKYHPILGVKTLSENVVNIGAYRDSVGFYGYKNGRTDNNWDWKFIFDSSNGNLETTGGITLYTASGNSPALTFLRGTDIDAATDWRMYVNSGQFKLQNKITSTAWTDVMSFTSPDVAKNLNLSYNLLPSTTNTLDLGSSSLKWSNVYATSFSGNLNLANAGTYY
jgi:hypothetical protein